MATLTTGWVSYATASFDSGPATIKFFLEAKYSSQNTTNNTTTVQTRLRSAYTEGSSISGAGYKFTCSYASTVSGSGVWYFSNEVITSGSKPIKHNGDGTKSITISASAYNKYWNFTKNLSATVTLPTIKRQANITSAPDFNDEANPTIGYNNPAGNSVSSLQACISLTGATDDIAYRDIPKTGTSYRFDLTEAERNVLRNATTTSNSRTVRFFVKTVIGGTTYHSSLTKTLTIVNANPDLTKTIVETNQKVIDVLGDNSASSLIQNASNVNITVTPTTLKGATVKSVAVNHNGTIQTITSSPYTFDIPVTSDSFAITVTDSRNNTSPVSSGAITKTLIPYQRVKQNSFSFKRVNPTSSNITFTLDSIYYQQTFGSVVNSPTITWKNGASGTVHTLTSQQYTIDNTNHTINVNLTIENELDYRSQETFYVEVSDALSSWSNNMLVSKGIPVFEFGDDEVQVNGDLYLADINRENKINVKNKLEEIEEKIEKNIITMYLNSNYTIPTANVQSKITGFVLGEQVGNKLTFSNNNIVIGAGVSKIKISYTIKLGVPNTTRVFTYLVYNGATISQEGFWPTVANAQGNISFSPRLMGVQEGDVFNLACYGQANVTIYGKSTGRFISTFMTIEVVD